MKQFLHKFNSVVKGVLSGFDRLIFRGNLLPLCHVAGMRSQLNRQGILLKDFKVHATSLSSTISKQSKESVLNQGKPFDYLSKASTNKKEIAEKLLNQDATKGLLCGFSAVEPCNSYLVHGDKASHKLILEKKPRKCLHVYYYINHAVFGFMHVRLQTWYPFQVQVYVNGREWLAQQLIKANLGFKKVENCFVDLEDFTKTQELMNLQLEVNWPPLLDRISSMIAPDLLNILGLNYGYYWSVHQSEWASDVTFNSQSDLERFSQLMIHHSMMTFKSQDVMKFLGRKLTSSGNIHGGFTQQVISSVIKREEGARIKFAVGNNSTKYYDKHGNGRFETTLNNVTGFKVFRSKQNDPDSKPEWLNLRKSVADIKRRSEIGQSVNNRLMDAISSVDIEDDFQSVVRPITMRAEIGGRKVRGLNPTKQDDLELLETIIQAKYNINGFQNRDIRSQLFSDGGSKEEVKKQSAKVSRLFRLLRAHGLIKKVRGSNRYHLTNKARKIIPAVIAANRSSVEKLSKIAA